MQESRIIVVADTPNLYRCAVEKYGRDVRLDYLGFRRTLLKVGSVRAEAVVNGGVATSFTVWLQRVGWFPVQSHAEDVDEMVITRAVTLHELSDCVVVASGDGKNVNLVRLLKAAGKVVFIAAIGGCIHRKLYDVADQVVEFPVLPSWPTAAVAA